MKPFAVTAMLLSLHLSAPLALAAPQDDGRDVSVSDTNTNTDTDRARALGRQLRCVVCQNQSIEGSDAELAADMRRLVRERIADGATDAQILGDMRERYGDFVLLRPPVQANTAVLWLAPLLLGGGGLAWWAVGARAARTSRDDALSPALGPEERARLDALRARAQDR